jgi:hypothetical protein
VSPNSCWDPEGPGGEPTARALQRDLELPLYIVTNLMMM